MKKEKVEGFRLTPETKKWMGQYKSLLKVKKMLESGFMVQMGRAGQLRDLLTQVTEGLQIGFQGAPEERTAELEGQEE